jgi:phospholipid transport system substrate-binding protein
MLQGRRRVLVLLAVLGVAFVAPGVPSAQDAAAGAFLESLTHDIFAKLADASLSQTEKERDLRSLFRQNFDVPAISRFVLGKYWRKASTAERQDFVEVFEEMNMRLFLAMVGEFSEEMFSVVKVRQDGANPSLSRVITEVGQSEGEPISAVWRVRNKDDQHKVFDVVIEGVSMAITLRHEYAAVVRTDGVDGLIAIMREKNATLAAGEIVARGTTTGHDIGAGPKQDGSQ